jgi:hypothetical protein
LPSNYSRSLVLAIEPKNQESLAIQLLKLFIFFIIGWFWQAVLMTWLPCGSGAHMSASLLCLFLLSSLLFPPPAAPHVGADERTRGGEPLLAPPCPGAPPRQVHRPVGAPPLSESARRTITRPESFSERRRVVGDGSEGE